MRISDWSSDVCSSDLHPHTIARRVQPQGDAPGTGVAAELQRHLPARKTQAARRIQSQGHESLYPGGVAAGKRADRKSVVEGKSVSVSVDLGGRRIIKKKKDNSRY